MNRLPPYQIVLADDHSLVRQGIRRIIEKDKNYKIVTEVGSGSELFQALRSHSVDLVIMDITMPDFNDIEVAKKIKEVYPCMKILIVSSHESKEIMNQAKTAGADGYVLKEKAAENLFKSIKMVL